MSDISRLNLEQWLEKIEKQHPSDIEFGLDRIEKVARSIGNDFYHWLKHPNEQVVLIGGTNGKGTTVAIVERLCLDSDLSVFSYTSPHLLCFNERFRLNGEQVTDQQLLQVFNLIESSRGSIQLTFFEYTTLAAFLIAFENDLDVLLLEIGLGGRLDAVNLIEPDISVITSISIDHTDWLGQSLIDIAEEKLAIARKNKKLILADNKLSVEMLKIAQNSGAECLLLGKDFYIEEKDTAIEVKIQAKNNSAKHYLVEKSLSVHVNNLAGALTTAIHLQINLDEIQLSDLLSNIVLPGRFEEISTIPHIIVDVSHNEQAISSLSRRIKKLKGPIYLVCGMLKDKAIKQSLKALSGSGYQWILCDLSTARGARARYIQQQLPQNEQVKCMSDVESALKLAISKAKNQGSIIVFGSFLTVEAAFRSFQQTIDQYKLTESGLK